jgi:hypothetical protein
MKSVACSLFVFAGFFVAEIFYKEACLKFTLSADGIPRV